MADRQQGKAIYQSGSKLLQIKRTRTIDDGQNEPVLTELLTDELQPGELLYSNQDGRLLIGPEEATPINQIEAINTSEEVINHMNVLKPIMITTCDPNSVAGDFKNGDICIWVSGGEGV